MDGVLHTNYYIIQHLLPSTEQGGWREDHCFVAGPIAWDPTCVTGSTPRRPPRMQRSYNSCVNYDTDFSHMVLKSMMCKKKKVTHRIPCWVAQMQRRLIHIQNRRQIHSRGLRVWLRFLPRIPRRIFPRVKRLLMSLNFTEQRILICCARPVVYSFCKSVYAQPEYIIIVRTSRAQVIV